MSAGAELEMVANFFDGYMLALEIHMGVDLFRGWNHWVAEELQPKFKNDVWWGQMLEFYGSDEKAIANLPGLFAKYLASDEFNRFQQKP